MNKEELIDTAQLRDPDRSSMEKTFIRGPL